MSDHHITGPDALDSMRSATPACRLDHQALANGLKGLEKRVSEVVKTAVKEALIEHTQMMGEEDDEHFPPVARRAAGVVTDHWWERFSQRFTMAVLLAGLAVLLAVGTYLAARLGVLK